MATFSLSFQMGSFVGGIIGGFLIEIIGYRAFYFVGVTPAVLGFVLLLKNWATISASGPIAVEA